MHPVGGRQVGWVAVRASLGQAACLAWDGKVEPGDQLTHIARDVAYKVGAEHGQLRLGRQRVTAGHRVTNISRREAEARKMLHHHTETCPAMLDVLNRLQPPSGQAGR